MKKIRLVGYAKKHSQYINLELSSHFRCQVLLDGKEIDPRASIILNGESVAGFAWGYSGHGPAQLAFAICLELFGPDQARKIYLNFREKHITGLPYGQDFDVEIDISEYEIPAENPARQTSSFSNL
jgi:hypothetical protein